MLVRRLRERAVGKPTPDGCERHQYADMASVVAGATEYEWTHVWLRSYVERSPSACILRSGKQSLGGPVDSLQELTPSNGPSGPGQLSLSENRSQIGRLGLRHSSSPLRTSPIQMNSQSIANGRAAPGW